jgi:hypothetical protein
MCMTVDELGKRAAILAIAARHGVQRVRVFGSFARGDARPDSDLDLLIEAGPHTPPWFPGRRGQASILADYYPVHPRPSAAMITGCMSATFTTPS